DQTAAAKGKSQTGAEGLSKPDTARLPLDSLATQSVESVPDGDSYSAQADGSSSAHGLSERRVSATILTRDGADLDPVVYHFRPDAAEDEPTPERDSTEDLFITLAQIPADDTCSGNSGRQPRTAGTVSVASRLVPENQSQGLLDVRHAQASGMNNAGGADRAVWTPSNRAPLLDDTSDAGTIQQNRDRQGSGPVPTNSDKFVGNEETHMGSCTTASTSLRVRHMSHTRHARSEEVPASSLCISFGELGPEWIAADSVSRKAHELPSVPMQYVGGAAPENVGLRDIALEKTDSLSSVTDSEAEVRAAANVMPSTSLGTTLTQDLRLANPTVGGDSLLPTGKAKPRARYLAQAKARLRLRVGAYKEFSFTNRRLSQVEGATPDARKGLEAVTLRTSHHGPSAVP
ncbi:Aats-arg, partial [Symbiodinium microadriaticum]